MRPSQKRNSGNRPGYKYHWNFIQITFARIVQCPHGLRCHRDIKPENFDLHEVRGGMRHERRREDVAQLYSSGLLWLSKDGKFITQTFCGVVWDCLFFCINSFLFYIYQRTLFLMLHRGSSIPVVHCPPSDAGDGLLETHGIPTGFCGGGPRFFLRRWKGFSKCKSTVWSSL